MHRVVHDRRRRVRTHPTGVRPRVSLARRLVVLRRCERHGLPATHHANEARLLAVEELLDHDPAPGVSERTAGEHFVHGGARLRLRLRDDDALARREPVRLDHDGRTVLANVGGCLGRVGELGVARGGDAVACEERLGERLRAFHLCRRGARAEDSKPFRLEPVRNPGDQRRFRPHHREVDRTLVREREQPSDVLRPHRDVLHPRLARGARIARRHQHPLHPLALRELPRQRVFASAAAHHQHGERAVRGRREPGVGRGVHVVRNRGSGLAMPPVDGRRFAAVHRQIQVFMVCARRDLRFEWPNSTHRRCNLDPKWK